MSVPSKAQFLQALHAVWPSLHDNRRAMLLAHFRAPSHRASMRVLALSAGYKTPRPANVQYGMAGRAISEQTGYPSAAAKLAGEVDWTNAIGSVVGPDSLGESQWEMHPELAAAMGEFISLEGIAVAVPDSDDTDALIGEASETERIELRKSRIGQGRFRDSVIDYWRACAATGCDEPTLLIASHIVPWRESSNHERLDGFNGLLLIPNLDRLFDKGWISFDDDGRILRSPQLRDSVAGTLGLNDGIQIKNLHPQHREHLVRHRNDVFKAA